MPTIEIPSPSEAAKYADHLADVVEDFKILGHGSRLAASFATGITQSNVSAVLNHRAINREWLDILGNWARAERQRRGI